jgi:hypothetical protein
MTWVLQGRAEELNPAGYDGRIWQWRLQPASHPDEGERTITVRISGTALAMGSETLPRRIQLARSSAGQSEVEQVLDWQVPPDVLDISSRHVMPQGGEPGPEQRELVEILAWFADQDISVFFTQAAMLGLGTAEPPPPGPVTAHLQKAGVDGLVGSHDGRDRLEAAGKAQVAWRDAKSKPIGTVTESNIAMPITPSLGSKGHEALETLRSHKREVVWTEPVDNDEGFWMLEVFDEEGRLLVIGLGDSQDDAILEVAEYLYPDRQ